MRRGVGVEDHGHARNCGNRLLQYLEALHTGLSHHHGESSDVAAWPGETRHMAAAKRVRVTHKYYWDRRGRSLNRRGVDGTRGHDDIDLKPDKFIGKFAHPLRFALRPSVLDGDGPPLHVPQLAKSLAESFKGIRKYVRSVPQKTNAVELSDVLRVRRKWPACRAPARFQALAPFHCGPGGS